MNTYEIVWRCLRRGHYHKIIYINVVVRILQTKYNLQHLKQPDFHIPINFDARSLSPLKRTNENCFTTGQIWSPEYCVAINPYAYLWLLLPQHVW